MLEKDDYMVYKRQVLVLILSLMVVLVGCSNKDSVPNDTGQISQRPDENGVDQTNGNLDEKEPIDIIEEKIKSLSLEEKIGQLIITGFEGTEMNEELISLIEEYKVGGFILFSRNITNEYQTLELLNDLKKLNSKNKIPLFLSIDEEGGKVSRLPKSYIRLPEAIEFGNKNDSKLSYELGYILGERVKALGFNMNYSPVLDINSNPNNPVIGSRAFGSTKEAVANNGIEVMLGIKDTNVIPVVKHFPGHGDTSVDSHIKLPKVNKSKEQLKDFELIPFIEAIEKGVDAIMIAHILYPQIDSYPASMSSILIDELLRAELGFNGVIISDDMTMGAIMENYTIEEAVLSFLKAGGDLALVCHGKDNPIKVIEEIKNAVNRGEMAEEEIDKKVYRILMLKDKYDLKDVPIDNIDLTDINNKTSDLISKIRN